MLLGLVKSVLIGVAALLAGLALIIGVQIYRNSGTEPLPKAPDGALRVATYNVHYILARRATGDWSLADWERRKGPLDEAFQYLSADLVAFQEMESFSGREADQDNLALRHLIEQNPGYSAAASGEPAIFPNTQPIFYRRDRLEHLDQGWFFFSTTPDVIYSRTFNGSYPAFASWASFRDKAADQVFYAVNIHTDYASRSNRLQSAALVAKRIASWIEADETVLVMGDMNARLGSRTLRIMEGAGITFAPVQGATYHFNIGLNLFGAIDHIGWAGAADPVGRAHIVRRKFSGEWPTDHYPYVLDIEFRHRAGATALGLEAHRERALLLHR